MCSNYVDAANRKTVFDCTNFIYTEQQHFDPMGSLSGWYSEQYMNTSTGTSVLDGRLLTHGVTIALLPSTVRPQSWAYVYIQANPLPSVPPSPEEHNLPSICPSAN